MQRYKLTAVAVSAQHKIRTRCSLIIIIRRLMIQHQDKSVLVQTFRQFLRSFSAILVAASFVLGTRILSADNVEEIVY